jgi:acetyl esterase/lipase
MEILSIIFLIISILSFVYFLISRFSFVGLFLREIGLWVSFVISGMIIAALTLGMHRFSDQNFLPMGLYFGSVLPNLLALVGLLYPFFQVRKTNKKLEKEMKKQLGENYLQEINPCLPPGFFKKVTFQLRHYFTGTKQRVIKKRIFEKHNITYRVINDRELKLDIYYPQKKGFYPTIIFIHGGGWIMGSRKQARNERIARLLTDYGYVVFNIDYRLARPKEWPERLYDQNNATIREMVSDIRSAIIFAKKNAEKYSADPSKVILFGRSAGGHLALLTALSCNEEYFQREGIKCSLNDARINGIVAFYPITNLREMYYSFDIDIPPKKAVVTAAGGLPNEKQKEYQKFSPVHYIDTNETQNIPPVFLITGEKDKIVVSSQSKELHQKLLEAGAKSVLLTLPWANHSFDTIISGPGGQLVYKYLTQFLSWTLSHPQNSELNALCSIEQEKPLEEQKVSLGKQ